MRQSGLSVGRPNGSNPMFDTLDKLPLWQIGGMIGCGCGLVCLLLRTNRKPHCRTYRVMRKIEPDPCMDCFCECGHSWSARRNCTSARIWQAQYRRRHLETQRELERW